MTLVLLVALLASPSSVCTAFDVEIELEGLEWDAWPETCAELLEYLRLTPPWTPESASAAERLFAGLGWFASARCSSDGEHLRCTLTPATLVMDVDIEGDVPFGLLTEDLRRRVFLRPGTVLPRGEEKLEEQSEHLEDYLRREGYFGSRVHVRLEPEDGAEPSAGVVLVSEIEPGAAVFLRSVRVDGASPFDAEEIRERLTHSLLLWFFTERFRPAGFQDDLDAIAQDMREDGWPEARLTGDFELDVGERAVDVLVRVETGPFLVLAFKGNQEIDDDDLADVATFAEVGVLDVVEIENTEAAIREKYQREGYYDVQVESRLEQPDPVRTELTIVIREGPHAEIDEVDFAGNAALDDDELHDHVDLRTGPPFLWFGGTWVDADVAADVRELTAWYRLQGFAEAHIEAQRRVLPDEKLEVVFRIEEGPRRQVAMLLFEGLPPELTRFELEPQLEVRTGTAFVEELLEEDHARLLASLAAHGYPRARVERDVRPLGTQPNALVLTYRVVSGARLRLGGTLLRGNFRTHPGFVADALELEPGDPLDLVALGAAKRRLRELGPFDAVDLVPLPAPAESSGDTWLLVALEENDRRAVDAVASYATDEGFTVGADLRDANLFGRAFRLDLRLRLGEIFEHIAPAARIGDVNRVDGALYAPRPFGVPFDAESSGFYYYQEQPLFVEEQLSVGAGVNRKLLGRDTCSKCPLAFGRLRYELAYTSYVQLSDVADGEQQVPDATIGRIIPSASLDYRDSAVDPREGFAVDLRFELAHELLVPFGGGETFWRFIPTAEGYLPLGAPLARELEDGGRLGGPLVLAASVNLGIGDAFGNSAELPESEAFTYGGTDVRGLENRASAEVLDTASYKVVLSAELRWYFLEHSAFGNFQLAGFCDLGTVADEPSGLFDEVAVTVGPMLRYLTPVGPFAVGWGIAVVRPPSLVEVAPETIPEQGRFLLSFGYSF